MNKIILNDYYLKYAFSLTSDELCYGVYRSDGTPVHYDGNDRTNEIKKLIPNNYEIIDTRYEYDGGLYIILKLNK